MQGEWNEVRVEDGGVMRLFTARPEGVKKAPGVLVLQEIFGVKAPIREAALRLAELGYVAVAPELFHRTAPPGFEAEYDFARVKSHYEAVTEASLTADLTAAYRWLTNDAQVDAKRIAAVGFCFGGRAAFQANGVLPLACAASFYGGNIAQQLSHLVAKQHGPILLAWGGKDAHIGVAAQRAIADALKAAEKPFVEIEFSEANHAFMNAERKETYHPAAAAQSWALLTEFFKTYLA